MDTKLIATLACAAALALGACSGGNPPAPAAPGTTDPGTTDPNPGTTDPDPDDPPADGMTEAQRFDRALAKAESDLAAARLGVTAATAALAAAGTGDLRTTALAGIADARRALAAAILAARELQAPSDDSGRIALAGRLAVKANAAEDQDLKSLRDAESSAGAGWPASSLVIGREILRSVPALPEAGIRTRRRNGDGTDAATLLTAAKIPAVMHEDGKVVMFPGLSSSGDRLRMRGIPVVWSGYEAATGTRTFNDNRKFLYTGAPLFSPTSSRPRPLVDPAGGGNNPPDPDIVPRLLAGLTITPSGIVVDMGGKGAPGLDFRLPALLASGNWINDKGSNGGYDLKLPFGLPAASPEGNAEHYWTATLPASTLPPPDNHGAITRISGLIGNGLGIYRMRLSNHAGLDKNLENSDDSAAYVRDDVNYYLSYAAYGHMEFVDSFVTDSGQTANIIPGRRTFPFHVGYDAFKGEAGMRTTDVADADKITGGTFRGRTLASQFQIQNLIGRPYPILATTDAYYLRLRGDVTLTVTISRTAADNAISGQIANLESWDRASGQWKDYARISNALTLQTGEISESGSFKGVIDDASYPSGSTAEQFAEGGYRGNFYGPLANLEAAGIWYLQDGNKGFTGRRLSIVGSFGAARVRDDGTYGVEVGPSAN